MGIESSDFGYYTQHLGVDYIVLAVGCFDWVMIILYLFQNLP